MELDKSIFYLHVHGEKVHVYTLLHRYRRRTAWGKKYMKQSKRRINILGVKRELLHPKREGAKHTVPSTFVFAMITGDIV